MIIPPMCEIKTFEQIKAELVALYQTIVPGYIPNESDTIMPVLESFTYRELLLRTHFNAQIAGSFWQSATAENLDFIAAFFWIIRLAGSKPTATVRFTISAIMTYDYVIEKELEIVNQDGSISLLLSNVTIPAGSTQATGIAELQIYTATSDAVASSTLIPKPYLIGVEQLTAYIGGSNAESDTELRERIALAFEDQTTAGSIGSYIAHSIRADERIDDVSVSSPTPGDVVVLLHSLGGVDTAMIDRVTEALNADRTRPLTDSVSVSAAAVVAYSVVASITIDPLADSVSTLASARDRLNKRLSSVQIGQTVTLSMMIAALSVDGVVDVAITTPLSNVTVTSAQVAVVSSVEVSVA